MKNVLVVDDHLLIFKGLSREFGDRFALTGVLDKSRAEVELSLREYDAVILDVTLGKEDGLSLLMAIPATIPVFILTMHINPHYARQAKDSGARGYFTKDGNLSLLRDAIEEPESRSFWCSDTMQEALDAFISHDASPYDSLTIREQEVFRLLAEGQNYKEVAFNLSISAKTVNVHRSNILQKLGISTQTELVKVGIRLGIIEAF